MVLLSSATPSVESYYKAKTGTYKLFEMTNRYNYSQMPSVDIIDMRSELEGGNKSVFGKSFCMRLKKH